MRRYSLIGAIAVTFSLAAAQSWGQEIKGPQAGEVQGTGQAAMGAERPAADAAGETARHDGNGQSLAAPRCRTLRRAFPTSGLTSSKEVMLGQTWPRH